MTPENPIDWTRLDDLRDEVGDEDFGEIAGLFIVEMREGAEGLCTCQGADLAAALHSLKGAALNLGFDAVARACRDAELAGTCDPRAIAALCRECEVILTTRFPDLPA